MQQRVAVIGGGSGGVAASASSARATGPRSWRARAGGVWARSRRTASCTRICRRSADVVVHRLDLDFPNTPSYVTGPQLGAYIEAYAHKFGVAPLTRFGAVTRVTLAGDSAARLTGGGGNLK